jgi:hypothetical protein
MADAHVDFSESERAIIISAKEDYLSLGQAELEVHARDNEVSARQVVEGLVERGYLEMIEIEQTTATRELRHVELSECLKILRDSKSWIPPLELGPRFFTLIATKKGEAAFYEFIGVRKDTTA